MEDLLTLKEIANRLGVPESNLRYYRNRIGDFLPSVGKGRRRRYFPEAEEIFRKTIDYINEGVTLDRIYAIFADNKPLALKEDIARPAQEELANLIVQKISDSGGAGPVQAEQSADTATVLRNQELILEKLGGIENLLAAGQGEAPDVETGGDVAALQNQILELQDQVASLADRLSEKEQIIDGQKKALLDAREKRSQLAEELEAARSNQQAGGPDIN